MSFYSGSQIELSTGTIITALLSGGSFSQVYLCRHTVLSQALKSTYRAIKVYPRESSKLRSQRIISEKTVLLRTVLFACPYIIKLLSTEKDDKYLYFVLEAYQCGSLNFHIRDSPCAKLPTVIARNYATEIVSALNCLMKCGCIHRDIKPANLIVDGTGHLKLCDFGASKILFAQDDYNNIINDDPISCAKTYTIIGTMQYMAPEIIARSYGYSTHIDWWALGVVLFEMLCGVPPTFKNIPLPPKDNNITATMNGTWPDEEISSVALNAINKSQKLIFNDGCGHQVHSDFCHYQSTISKLDPWNPVLSESDFAALYETELSRFGWDLIQKLLIPNPAERLGPWSIERIQNHPFFHSVNWEDVDAGRSNEPDIEFNKSLGFLDLIDALDDNRSVETNFVNENLFEGF